MPEGPSIILLKEAVAQFTGKKVLAVEGNTKTIDKDRLLNQKVIAFKSWGKHFLICFKNFTVKVHFLMFGSYLVKNEILYRQRVHPESIVKKIPIRKIRSLIKDTRVYSFQFLEWKRNFVLRKHWLAHTKTICPRCKGSIIKKYTGIKKRRSFFCKK